MTSCSAIFAISPACESPLGRGTPDTTMSAEGGREGGRERGREGGREGGSEEVREEEREAGSKGRREGVTEGGREAYYVNNLLCTHKHYINNILYTHKHIMYTISRTLTNKLRKQSLLHSQTYKHIM